jgi:hypothetical protein
MTERSPITPVMAGRVCVGFVFARGREGFEAFDDDKSLGLFPDKSAAIAALCERIDELEKKSRQRARTRAGKKEL